MVKRFAFAVPGDLATPTGGYAYDRRMIAELGKLGWQIDIVDLGAVFPFPSDTTRKAAHERLLAIPADRVVVVDGLALGVLPEAARRLDRLVALGAPSPRRRIRYQQGASRKSARQRTSRPVGGTACRGHQRRNGAAVVSRTTPFRQSALPSCGPAPIPCRRHRGGADNIVRLLSVGAVVPRKGYDVLIAALATLPDLQWRLTIAGDCARNPKTAAQLKADIERHGLGERVAVLGAVSEQRLAELYAEADIFALASRFEGYGMAYAEAIAHGLPVVGTNAGAIPGTVPTDAGLLVAPDDVSRLCVSAAPLDRQHG